MPTDTFIGYHQQEISGTLKYNKIISVIKLITSICFYSRGICTEHRCQPNAPERLQLLSSSHVIVQLVQMMNVERCQVRR